MQQTTHDRNRNQTGPLADAGPYDYDLPVVSGVGPPAPAPRRASLSSGFDWKSLLVTLFATIGARALRDWSGWSQLYCYTIIGCVVTVFIYWDTSKPRRGFLPWTLKVVGIYLNLYVALVTVPQSLRGPLPDALAFGLPAFLFMLAFHWVPPLVWTGKTHTLRKWLLWSLAFAAFWACLGPSAVK